MEHVGLSRLVHVGHIVPDRHWSMPAHQHEWWELIVPVAGRMHVLLGGEQISAGPGTVLLYPRGVTHEEHADVAHPVATQFIAFNWDQDSATVPVRGEDVDGRIRQAVQWLYTDRDLADSWLTAQQRDATLRLILISYLACVRRNTRAEAIVRRVRRHVREHLPGPLTLRELADLAGLSPFHFIRVYRTLAGRTPMQDVRAIRLEHARELLLTTTMPLKQIAPRCGLGSEYALSRAFSRQFGYPPSTLRRRGGDNAEIRNQKPE